MFLLPGTPNHPCCPFLQLHFSWKIMASPQMSLLLESHPSSCKTRWGLAHPTAVLTPVRLSCCMVPRTLGIYNGKPTQTRQGKREFIILDNCNGRVELDSKYMVSLHALWASPYALSLFLYLLALLHPVWASSSMQQKMGGWVEWGRAWLWRLLGLHHPNDLRGSRAAFSWQPHVKPQGITPIGLAWVYMFIPWMITMATGTYHLPPSFLWCHRVEKNSSDWCSPHSPWNWKRELPPREGEECCQDKRKGGILDRPKWSMSQHSTCLPPQSIKSSLRMLLCLSY